MSVGKRKSISSAQKNLLLAEVSSECPLCFKKLVVTKGANVNNEFEIAHIYPLHPTEKDKMILASVNVPESERDELDNLIPLCKTCHPDYDNHKTLDKYDNLLSIKRRVQHEYKAKGEINALSVEDAIAQLIEKILHLDISEYDKAQLNYKPSKVKEKILKSNMLLSRKIETNVSVYYLFIKEEFRRIVFATEFDFDKFASLVRTAYFSVRKKDNNQEKTFDMLVEWLVEKTDCPRSACEIMLSYFVQNCEVYDNITK